jgi:2-polyprenyl-3-methyl-5-hydroxy-6-metoxy-1,4-benzoquinol methylase
VTIHKNRQSGTTLADIRADHVRRYREAANFALEHGLENAADVGAGYGYGSWLLAVEGGLSVVGYDFDPEVIPFAEKHWGHEWVERRVLDLNKDTPDTADLLVGFEVIEHIDAPRFLCAASDRFDYFVGSVPNEELVPFGGPNIHPEHVRHYTPTQLWEELEDNGWEVIAMGCQIGKRANAAKIRWDTNKGRTLIFKARSKQ